MYETSADREREQAIAEFAAQQWMLTVELRPRGSAFDAIFSLGEQVICFAEVKWRDHDFGDYPTLMIDVTKNAVGRYAIKGTDVKFRFIIAFRDDVRYYELTEDDRFDVTMKERKDRGDPLDRDPVILIPLERFVKIGMCEALRES